MYSPESPFIVLEGAHQRFYRVQRGVLDEAARIAFSCGQCHALALAVHEQTGWPLEAFFEVAEWGPTLNIDHVCVRMPDGRLLDARGAWSQEVICENFYLEELRPVDANSVKALDHAHGWRIADVETARSLVPALLIDAQRASEQATYPVVSVTETAQLHAETIRWLCEKAGALAPPFARSAPLSDLHAPSRTTEIRSAPSEMPRPSL